MSKSYQVFSFAITAVICIAFMALFVGCVGTGLLHNYLLNQDAEVALKNSLSGRPVLCADAVTPFWEKTDWDVIQDNWYLYTVTLVIDGILDYYAYKGFQAERDSGGGDPQIVVNYPPIQDKPATGDTPATE